MDRIHQRGEEGRRFGREQEEKRWERRDDHERDMDDAFASGRDDRDGDRDDARRWSEYRPGSREDRYERSREPGARPGSGRFGSRGQNDFGRGDADPFVRDPESGGGYGSDPQYGRRDGRGSRGQRSFEPNPSERFSDPYLPGTERPSYGQYTYPSDWRDERADRWNPYRSSGGSIQFDDGRFGGRGPKGYRRADDRIREEVCDGLTADTWIDAGGIDVQVKGGVVTLEGTVPDRRTKRAAEDLAERVTGVEDVTNSLRVQDRASGEAGFDADRSKDPGTGPGSTKSAGARNGR